MFFAFFWLILCIPFDDGNRYILLLQVTRMASWMSHCLRLNLVVFMGGLWLTGLALGHTTVLSDIMTHEQATR